VRLYDEVTSGFYSAAFEVVKRGLEEVLHASGALYIRKGRATPGNLLPQSSTTDISVNRAVARVSMTKQCSVK